MLTAFLRNLIDILYYIAPFEENFWLRGDKFLHTLCATVRTGAAGRPIYAMTEAEIQLLMEEGCRWEVIACCSEVLSITLREEEEEKEEENVTCLLVKKLITFLMRNCRNSNLWLIKQSQSKA